MNVTITVKDSRCDYPMTDSYTVKNVWEIQDNKNGFATLKFEDHATSQILLSDVEKISVEF